MPEINRRDDKYSSIVGVIYVFNLILGTGALALPITFQKSGWALAICLLLVLVAFSFITVTFVLESLSVANAVSRKRYQENIEQTPLVTRTESQELNNVFEITEKYEIGQMAVLMCPKWCQIIIYMTLCVYLYGDMAIYEVVIGKTFSHIICDQTSSGGKVVEDEDPCFENYTITRLDVHHLSIFGFICLVGPFIFFNVQKTKFLQFLTSFLRWLAFFVMLAWSSQKLVKDGKQGNPPVANFTLLPSLFGTLVYSFMCQHSIPGLIQPISNKRKLKYILIIDFGLAAIFYLALSLTAIFAFQNVEGLYTLNFWKEVNAPGTSLFQIILAYYLALFPVFTLTTSFPIIGITLKNNLRAMFLKDRPPHLYFDKILFPLATLIPPSLLALAVSDIQTLVGVVGSYAGAGVQYLIPCLLVFYARKESKDFTERNIYASPFKSQFWIHTVYAWMTFSLILISINYIMRFRE